MNYGVDRYKRPEKISIAEEKARQEEREAYLQSQVNALWRTVPKKAVEQEKQRRFPSEPQENILYFIEKHAPLLEPWQREIVRIVRKVSQYFYPQKQTQVMNEGWATFWHYTILNHLYDEGLLSDKFMLEFLHSHTSVVAQPPYNSRYFSGINPYALGLPCSVILSGSAKSRPRKIKSGSQSWPAQTGWMRFILRCATLKMRALSANICHLS